jgi:hypothetical protein
MIEWYKNRYNECDGVLEKTIRYRQVVGLLSASSISAFRSRGFSSASAATADTQRTSDKVENDETTNRAEINETNSPEKTHCHSAVTKRRRRHENQLVALHVAYYLFHNNSNEKDRVKSNQPSLSSLKKSQIPNKFLLQLHHHHPGYVPIRLWQGFMTWEQHWHCSHISCNEAEATAMTITPHDSKGPASSGMIIGRVQGSSPHSKLQCIPICFDCGGIVQPGIQNTTIRLVRNDPLATTRTQRRRESRRKAAMSQKQHQSIKHHVNHVQASVVPNPLPHARSKIWQYIWQQQNKYYHNAPTMDLRKLYPFMNCCKNYYIVTCGSCAARIYLPGISSSSAPMTTNGQTKRGGTSKKWSANATESVSAPNDTMASLSEASPMKREDSETVESTLSNQLDVNPRKRKVDAAASKSNAASLNDRKKKKKKPPKSAELMKFLSSLNDGTG